MVFIIYLVFFAKFVLRKKQNIDDEVDMFIGE